MSEPQADARRTYWRKQLDAWQLSGQSRRAFCRDHNLDYYRFGYWRKKFQSASEEEATHHASNAFVPVVPETHRGREGLSLTLPNGAVLQGIRADNLATVCQLLAHWS